MGLFESLAGAVLGGGDKTQMLTSLASSLIANHSSGQGLNGLVQQFEGAGLGHLVQSWIGNGQNLPITAQEVEQVLGNQFVQQFAQQHGIPLATASSAIAQLLPQLVNHATPDGQVPSQTNMASILSGLLGGGNAPAAPAPQQ
jgi:uncharacterized protein YidB (DUF937 family)